MKKKYKGQARKHMKQGMKISFLSFIFTILVFTVHGQSNCQDSTKFESYKNKTHHIIGLIPCNARVTNGLSIGWSTSIDDYCAYMNSIRINGVYINASPLQVLMAGMGLVMIPFALLMPKTYKNLQPDTSIYVVTSEGNQLNGLGISLFEVGEDFTFNGLHIPILTNNSGNLNGVSTSLIYNKYRNFSGVMLTILYNNTIDGKGIQIGLINNAKRMTGIQIGLWNKIGKRGLPFINMSFKKK
jgi:hypothetical protein